MKPTITTFAALVTLLQAGGAALGQNAAGDWPTYNRDLAGTRYSPLSAISRDNVRDLREVWSYSLGRNSTTGDLGGGSQFTPLVIDGVMYLAGADRIVALQADTGREIWRFQVTQGPPSRRGLAYWPGDGDLAPRLFVTSGRLLIGIDTGNGNTFSRLMPVGYAGAPAVFENLLIVGSNTPPGSVRAFDARTGDEIWSFASTPAPG
ncbi:MAG TPA: PQQ-binding-like beta-propeller repeat protein, partial [Gammaproteobacteria bacterium]